MVVEMTNSSANYDWPAIWGALWQGVIARHDIYVSITVKPNVFCTNYSASGSCIAGMQVFDPARYDRLSMANPLPPPSRPAGCFRAIRVTTRISPSYTRTASWYRHGFAAWRAAQELLAV